jgi:hypothetical protein
LIAIVSLDDPRRISGAVGIRIDFQSSSEAGVEVPYNLDPKRVRKMML